MARKVLRKGLPSITEVASRAAVSPATVSRYFNSPEMVKEGTRERIAQVVNELGYVPHAASRLSPNSSGTIGLVVPTIDNAIFSEMIQEFSSTLFRNAQTMLIGTHNYDLGREAILTESLLQHGIDAIALIGLVHNDETLQQLNRYKIPSIMLWNYRARQPWPCIGFDNREAAAAAIKHLIDLGHDDILLLLAETSANDRAADRRSGALAALKATGNPAVAERRIVCPYEVQACKTIVMDYLREGRRPTAIFAANDVIAQGAMFACLALGIRLPEEMSIIGIGDFRGSSSIEPGLTTMRVPAKRIGRRAAEALVEMINWPAAALDHGYKYTAELIERGSTAAPPVKVRS